MLLMCDLRLFSVFIFLFQMDIDDGMSEVLYEKLLELEKEVRRKLTERNIE